MNEIKNIVAVIVLYKTSYLESVTFQSLVRAMQGFDQILDVVIYDNSPKPAVSVREFSHKNLNIYYQHDPVNSGVSKAYNFGAKYAKGIGLKNWLLLLDQDTSFEADLLVKYLAEISRYPDIRLFAPILKLEDGMVFSPCKFMFKRGFRLKEVNPGILSLKHISPVNSGMMIGLKSFFNCGGYNENVKLDFSDFQFIERFKKTESHFCVINAVGYQDFSNAETDVDKLNLRYAFYCDGAKNFEKPIFVDHVQFFIVAFMRALTLSLRNKRLVFFKTFYNSYIKG